MPHEGLKRVRSQLVRVHGGERASQVVEAVDVAEPRVLVLLAAREPDAGVLLDLGEDGAECAPVVVPGQDERLEGRQLAQMVHDDGVQLHALVALRCCRRPS